MAVRVKLYDGEVLKQTLQYRIYLDVRDEGIYFSEYVAEGEGTVKLGLYIKNMNSLKIHRIIICMAKKTDTEWVLVINPKEGRTYKDGEIHVRMSPFDLALFYTKSS